MHVECRDVEGEDDGAVEPQRVDEVNVPRFRTLELRDDSEDVAP